MSVNKYSTQDLLDVILNNKDIDVIEYDDFINFLLEYNLKIGEELVKIDFLYELYKNKGKLTKKEFIKELKKHFIIKKEFVKLNINSINLSEKAKKLIPIKKPKKLFEIKKYIKHFNLFLLNINIEKGNLWCSIHKLYKLYLCFCLEKRLGIKIPKKEFINFFKHFNFEIKNDEYVRINNYEKDKT